MGTFNLSDYSGGGGGGGSTPLKQNGTECIFTASGNFAVPATTKEIYVEMVGGGGGGGKACPGGPSAGGGGGGGGFLGFMPVTSGDTLCVVVGAAGVCNPSGAGTSGGASCICSTTSFEVLKVGGGGGGRATQPDQNTGQAGIAGGGGVGFWAGGGAGGPSSSTGPSTGGPLQAINLQRELYGPATGPSTTSINGAGGGQALYTGAASILVSPSLGPAFNQKPNDSFNAFGGGAGGGGPSHAPATGGGAYYGGAGGGAHYGGAGGTSFFGAGVPVSPTTRTPTVTTANYGYGGGGSGEASNPTENQGNRTPGLPGIVRIYFTE